MKYIATLSFGKDSLAQLIKIKELGLPLDEVIYCDIRYSKEIRGEHPLLAEWIPTAEKILKDKFGVTVTHLSSKKSFKEYYYTKRLRGKHIGEIYGVPFYIGAWCNSGLKVSVMNKYIGSIKEEVTQYIGLAHDEQERIDRMREKETPKKHYRFILDELEINEDEAFKICEAYDLVSPHYSNASSYRGGCWFCVKQPLSSWYDIWRNYPELFAELEKIEKDNPSFYQSRFCCNKTCEERRLQFENGFIPKRRKKQQR